MQTLYCFKVNDLIMKKLLCSLILLVASFIVKSQPLAVTMVTTTSTGSSFSIALSATASSTAIKVDWGNGTLVDYTIGISSTVISGTLAGPTVKIYGSGISILTLTTKNLTSLDVSGCNEIKELYCNNNSLTSLDVSNKTALTYLDCRGNQLTSLNLSNAIGNSF